MLRIPEQLPWILPIHLLICAALCSGLSALAVGLGARFPDLKENAPAKIAAGFGGTLTLILSALYVVGLVVITALPTYWGAANARRKPESKSPVANHRCRCFDGRRWHGRNRLADASRFASLSTLGALKHIDGRLKCKIQTHNAGRSTI